jgi:hypothetical protein
MRLLLENSSLALSLLDLSLCSFVSWICSGTTGTTFRPLCKNNSLGSFVFDGFSLMKKMCECELNAPRTCGPDHKRTSKYLNSILLYI